MVWTSKRRSTHKVILTAIQVLLQWQEAQCVLDGPILTPIRSAVTLWSPLAPSFTKCNVDASIFHLAETIGFGFITCNEKGEVDTRIYGRVCGMKDTFIAEALGCERL